MPASSLRTDLVQYLIIIISKSSKQEKVSRSIQYGSYVTYRTLQ